ncbi:MAG TPA: hypothetical protein VD994_16480 [Prosthecobacter sp.]|nr:hypothetical protein [Prosthecobacter sp.]
MQFRALRSLLAQVRAAAPDETIIIFGSSCLFASFPKDDPNDLGVEVTIDADFLIDPDDVEVRKRLSEQFGQNNEYHIKFGYYGDFVDQRISETFPPEWRKRLVPFPGFEGVFAIDPVDMAATKLLVTAGARLWSRLGRSIRDRGTKEIDNAAALLATGRIQIETLRERIATMHLEERLIVELGKVVEETLAAARMR